MVAKLRASHSCVNRILERESIHLLRHVKATRDGGAKMGKGFRVTGEILEMRGKGIRSGGIF